MSDVQVYGLQFKVTLFKTVKRETIDGARAVSARFGATAPEIDLTPYFTDVSTISTSGSVRDPAGGFQLTMSDQPYIGSAGTDSLYGIIEPMDMVEIRFQRYPNGTTTMPVVMRGFVSTVSRGESVGATGEPMRSVTIVGQDYGKLWQMLQIYYGPGYVIGQDIISAFKMYERFGAGFKIGQSGAELLGETFDKILNPYITEIVFGNSSNPPYITVKATQTHGVTSLSGTQNAQDCSIYELLRRFLDVGVWNELFIAEDNDGVYCIYRPNPALDVNGNPVDPQSQAPVKFDPAAVDVTKLVYHEVPAADIVSMNVSRTDANLSNYYWVRAPRYELTSDIYRKQDAATGGDKTTVDLTDYVNSKGKLYGIRKLEVQTEMGGDDISNTASGLPENEQTKRDTSMINWIANRRQILVEQNRDNVLLEQGSITIKGNEHIRKGNFVKIIRGTFEAMYYVVAVDHHFSPFNRFTTTLQVDRGMGFVERLAKGGGKDSPYYAELAGS